MVVKILCIFFLFPYLISSESLELTDKTWQNMLRGQWMVEFYAPWCPACQQFTRPWNDFSNAMSSKNIKVAAVNIDQYPSLSGRFRISALPTVYHVNDGVFRQYNGERSLRSLKNYIENEEWKKTEPVSSHFAPNSILMSLAGSVLGVSVFVKDAYTLLHDQYGWPAWLVYIIFGLVVISIGIFLGFFFLLITEFCIALPAQFYPKAAIRNKKVEEDRQKLLKSKPTVMSSTINNQDDSCDIVPIIDEEEKRTTTDQTVRQRRVEK